MRILYNITITLYALAVRIAAIFNSKAKLLSAGWRNWRGKVPFEKLDGKVAWFHASSLGEFEQARPVIETFRSQHPDYKVCLTFFSPSGYEIRKNYSAADVVLYLPPDTRRNARNLVKLMHPDIAFFVKYDFWFNYLNVLDNNNIPTYIFSAIFRPNQYFFRWYGRWFARQLHCYSHIFVQNSESLELLHSVGINDVSVAGDTRYDRVVDIAKAAQPIDPIELFLTLSSSGTPTSPRAAKHSNNPKVLVAGSSWEPDERNIKAFIDNYNQPIKLILAPHVIDESHLAAIEKLFGKDNCLRFSALKQSSNQSFKHSSIPSILIIDNIGMLSSIYQYATVAYIGGGFGKGIHNILEATAYGIPVCFGPNYMKFKEARDMIDFGCAKSYSSPDQLQSILANWLDNPSDYSKACQICHQAMAAHGGSTNIILNTCKYE